MVPVGLVNSVPKARGGNTSAEVTLSKYDDTPPSLVPASDCSSTNSEHAPRISWRNGSNVTNARATTVKSRSASHAVTHARTTIPKPPLPVKAARAIHSCAHSHHADGRPPMVGQQPLQEEQPEQAPPKTSSETSEKKHVRFGNVEMRNYEIVLGDHPDCSSGPPVSIGWKYSCAEPISIDKYESLKPRRRSMDQLELNYFVRKRMLRRISGVSDDEMHNAINQVRSIQKQRKHTKRMQPIYKLQETSISIAEHATNSLSLKKETPYRTN